MYVETDKYYILHISYIAKENCFSLMKFIKTITKVFTEKKVLTYHFWEFMSGIYLGSFFLKEPPPWRQNGKRYPETVFVSDSQANFNHRNFISIFDLDRLTGNPRKTPVNFS